MEERLARLGFKRFACSRGKCLTIEQQIPAAPAVYLAVLRDKVFWVGETGSLKSRFASYCKWFGLPDDHPRRDRPTRDQLVAMTNSECLVFFYKEPDTYYSKLTGKAYPAHRVEETALIDYFQPEWNLRKGGRRRG